MERGKENNIEIEYGGREKGEEWEGMEKTRQEEDRQKAVERI